MKFSGVPGKGGRWGSLVLTATLQEGLA